MCVTLLKMQVTAGMALCSDVSVERDNKTQVGKHIVTGRGNAQQRSTELKH